MAIERPYLFKARADAPRKAKIIDIFQSSLEELFFINNPQFRRGMNESKKPLKNFLTKNKIKSIWIYYPWNNRLIRTLPESLYFKLRTARNRKIITEGEQANYRNIKVGIAGLSVGSAVLNSLVISGGPKIIKIADYDTIEVTNLNRIRAKLTDVGENKAVVAARDVWEIDPFADLYLREKGLNKNNLRKFILGKPRLDLFIDEMDNLEFKILARKICKKNRIPVVMATDNGDGALLDIERFDLEPKRPIFHGSLKDKEIKNLKRKNFREWLKLAIKIIGPRYMTERHQESILEIGKTLSGVPQLGTAASIAGTAAAIAARRIANKQKMPSGRYVIDPEEELITGYDSLRERKLRDIRTKRFKRELESGL